MKKLGFMIGVTRTLHKAGFEIKKHSPEILVVVGVVGTVTSAVMACKATTKIDTILSKTKEDVDFIRESAERGYVPTPTENVEYSEEDSKKDLAIVYAQTGLKFAKLYAPAIILGTLSITSILVSNNILRKRNIALAAAYATVDRGFKEYRNRVVERFGAELDKELKYNVKAKEIEETTVDEKGKEKTVKKTVNVMDPNQYSDYARFFDETCSGYSKNAESNLCFLKSQMSWANERLRNQGYLFLNDVYEMLGIPKTKAGQIVGWIYDPNDKDADNFVDFGIYDGYRESVRNFVNGYERSILLDFNVTGNILDKFYMMQR